MKTIPIVPVAESPRACASSALVALCVLDASMAPELCPGHTVVIDQSARLTPDSLVLVETRDQLLIRRWRTVDSDEVELFALNPLWKSVRLNRTDVQFKGVVVQRAGRRRRESKRYG